MHTIPHHKITKFNYYRYRLLSNITFGKLREKYELKRKSLKILLHKTTISENFAQMHNKIEQWHNQLTEKNDFICGALNQMYNAVDQLKTELRIQHQEQLNIYSLQLKTEFRIQHQEQLSIYSLHQNVFPKYKNINQGKELVIVATGPSLKDYIPIKNAIYIGVNAAIRFPGIELDYYFAHDYQNLLKNFPDAVNYKGRNTKKFFGILKYNFPDFYVPESMAIEAGAERYYVNTKWCEEIPYDITVSPIPEYGSVVFHALLFALWTNPRRIYIVGADTCSGSHFNDIGGFSLSSQQLEPILRGWSEFKKYAKIYYPESEIISINPVGLKGLFKDIYQKREE